MGNALRFLYGHCCKPSSGDSSDYAAAGSVSALAGDIFNFENTSEVNSKLLSTSHRSVIKTALDLLPIIANLDLKETLLSTILLCFIPVCVRVEGARRTQQAC